MSDSEFDVVVVGAGNAAFCAALSAEEGGAHVLMLECAPEHLNGGNSRFTAGVIRFAYNGVEDLLELMPDLSDKEIAMTDFGTYTEEQFFDDMFRVTQYRTDPDLCEILVKKSFATIKWIREKGLRFVPIYGRQAFKIDGRFQFWGGLTVEAVGGGPGLVDTFTEIAQKKAIDIWYQSRALKLVVNDNKITGIMVNRDGELLNIKTKTVVIASGGFQSSAEKRTRYLGPSWDLAKVRGTAFNTGGGIDMALEIGASSAGNWSGCHAVGWDRNAPEYGDLTVGDGFQKHSYPFGIMVNADGERFVDEGADFRNYTYAKYGRIILNQPGNFAWQVFDAKVTHLLRDEYRIQQVTKVKADSLEELASKLEGVDAEGFLANVATYNAAVQSNIAFNPNVKDGRNTLGLKVPKSNWANTIDEGPFEAYAVTCGITFTFGGLRIDTRAAVQSTDLTVIPGLFAAGEAVGGIFYHNYPGGTGLMSGAVFGKIAGASAAQWAAAQ